MDTNHTARRLSCSKCNGRGRLDWTSQDRGVCYDCGGVGTVRTLSADAIKAACAAAADCANIAAQGIARGDESYARSYARSAAAELHKVGTDRARDVLARVLAGRVWDAYGIDGANAHGVLDIGATAARRVFRLICEEGESMRV
jgi:hypothetical protein